MLDRYPHIAFAGRVAYIGLGHCDWMADDVLAPCLDAFAKLNVAAKQLLLELVDRDAFEIAKAILAFEKCFVIYEAVDALSRGEVEVRCPAETCGVPLWIQPRDEGLVAVLARESGEDEDVDSVESVVERTAPVAFDPDAPWTDADALPRLIVLANASHAAASHLEDLGGTVACPKCGERFSIRDELLEPTGF